MAELQPCWASLTGSLLDCIFSHLDSDSLARCCMVCKAWRSLLSAAGSSGAPWAAALLQEHGCVSLLTFAVAVHACGASVKLLHLLVLFNPAAPPLPLHVCKVPVPASSPEQARPAHGRRPGCCPRAAHRCPHLHPPLPGRSQLFGCGSGRRSRRALHHPRAAGPAANWGRRLLQSGRGT